MTSTVLRSIRVEKELMDWFEENFPWRGSFPGFINHALAEFRKQYGDRLPPGKVVDKAMAELVKGYK